MTRLLASVTSAAEARIALTGGADIIDLKDPQRGALGALPPQQIATAVRTVAGRRPVSATVGDPPYVVEQLLRTIAATVAAGADYVKMAITRQFADANRPALAQVVNATRPAHLVAVLFADRDPDLSLIGTLADAGFHGVMLDTAAKKSGRLRDHVDDAALQRFVGHAHAAGLIAGLAGSLHAADILHLLPLGADYLGFRGALCAGGRREAALDATRIAEVRRAIAARGEAATVAVGSSISENCP
jgi:dihydroneopterin aldolase